MPDITEIYNQCHLSHYRESLSGYEIARWNALDHFITRILKLNGAKRVLDYGAGSGLHVQLWEKLFPHAELYFCDISAVAGKKFKMKYPNYADRYYLVHQNRANLDDRLFDVVVSVEVMEHVEQLVSYLRDIYRLLKPNGTFVWTTPCANELSIEHLYARATGKIESTEEGFRRWKWEDPTHVRRLKSHEIKKILEDSGFSNIRFRFRAHFFSFICTYLPTHRMMPLREKLMTLDYSLFRSFPNGASMLGSAKRAK